MKSKGLGDSVEKFTTATGIKSLTQFLSNKGVFGKGGCNCNKRKEALNKAFPYKNKQYGKHRYSISKSFSFS